MRNLAQALILIGWHADDVKYQRALRFRAHHTIQGRQFADPISGRQHSHAPYAGIAIRGVRRVQFVGTTDPFDLWAALDRVAHREQVVPGDSKAMRDALVGAGRCSRLRSYSVTFRQLMSRASVLSLQPPCWLDFSQDARMDNLPKARTQRTCRPMVAPVHRSHGVKPPREAQGQLTLPRSRHSGV